MQFSKAEARKPRKIRLSGPPPTIQTPYRLSYFLWFSGFWLSETVSYRLFLFIIFSFQNFRYHSGIRIPIGIMIQTKGMCKQNFVKKDNLSNNSLIP